MKKPVENSSTQSPFARFINAAGILALVLLVTAVLASVLTRQFELPGNVVFSDIQHYALSVLVYAGILSAWFSNAHISAGLTAKSGKAKPFFAIAWMSACVVLPMGVIAIIALPDIFAAWKTLETSRQQGGLPGLFLIKTVLPVFCVTLGVLALVSVRRLLKQR